MKLIPKFQSGNRLKYYGTYSPKELAYLLPRTIDKNGEINVGLPEIKVTPNLNTDLGTVMQGRGNFGKTAAEFTPVGDVMDIYNIGKDVYKGNYGLAALGAGLFFLPDIIAKPAKRLFRKAKKAINAKRRIDDFEKRIIPEYNQTMQGVIDKNSELASYYIDKYNDKFSYTYKYPKEASQPKTEVSYPNFDKWKAKNVKDFSNKHDVNSLGLDITDSPQGVEITANSGFDTNNYITSGKYSVPIFGTDRVATGDITVRNPSLLRTTNFTNPDIPAKVNGGFEGFVNVPEDYTKSLQLNIEYLKKIFPGFKEFGSSAGVVNAGFPHSTHDIDGFISDVDFNKILGYNKNIRRKNRDTDDVDTYLINLDNKVENQSGYNSAKDIDMNIVYTDPNTGKARGANARELYSQFFPDEYQNAVDLELLTGNFEINKTPLELLEAYNPTTKTIMDSFEIDFTKPKKGKHAGRPLVYLSYGNPLKVSEGLHQFAKEFVGSNVELPQMNPKEFSDFNRNMNMLKKWDIRGDLNAIAKDPQKMQNAMDYWVLNTSVSSRAVDGINNLKDLHSAMTTWLPESLGGNANGAGLNSVLFGDSKHPGYYSMTQPHLDIEGKTPEEITDYINRLTGQPTYQFTSEEKNIISDILNSRGYNASRIKRPQDILNIIPNKGNESDLILKEILAKLGIPFITKSTNYGNSLYRSFTAPFDLTKGHMHYRAPLDARPSSLYIRNKYIDSTISNDEFSNKIKRKAMLNYNSSKKSRTDRKVKPEYEGLKNLYYDSLDKLSNKYYDLFEKHKEISSTLKNKIEKSESIPNLFRAAVEDKREDLLTKGIWGTIGAGALGLTGKFVKDAYESPNKYDIFWALTVLKLNDDLKLSKELIEAFSGPRGRDFAKYLKLLPPELAAQQLTDKVRQLQIKHLRKKK